MVRSLPVAAPREVSMSDSQQLLHRPVRVIAADGDSDACHFYLEQIPALGHHLLAVVHSGRELLERCVSLPIDVLIVEAHLPDGDGVQAAMRFCERQVVPVVLTAAGADASSLENALRDHVFAYVSKPLRLIDLAASLLLAVRRFELQQALRREVDQLRETLEGRKLIERAKAVVMRRLGVNEEEALKRLRKLSGEQNRKLSEVAWAILTAEEALMP